MNIIVSRPLLRAINLPSNINGDRCFFNNLTKYKIPNKSLYTEYRRMVILRYTPAAWNLD